jgi:hypothetical protein
MTRHGPNLPPPGGRARQVTVLNEDRQSFEYFNCYDATGMLRASQQPAQLQRS